MMLLDESRLTTVLSQFAPRPWIDELIRICSDKLRPGVHGDLPGWIQALDDLPRVEPAAPRICDASLHIDVSLAPADAQRARDALRMLAPWRKGPFSISDIVIDAEWRSNLKWDRIEPVLGTLEGKRILDVGSGNGYYAMRMAVKNAETVLGLDPTLLFLAQFAAISHFATPLSVFVLPLRLAELPSGGPSFDTVLSMGVLYHQRDPAEHLQQLRNQLSPDGQLLLETLIIPGNDYGVIVPEARYARMRNVWHLPTRKSLVAWLEEAGFENVSVEDEAYTTIDEQRTTAWMPYESLREALDPDDPQRTIEQLPAPLRIVISARLGAQSKA